MKTTLLALLVCIGFGTSFAQTSSLNKFDSANQKDGRWLVYLDANGAKVKDSTTAVYKRYTWFDHGVNTLPMGDFITKGGKIETTGAPAEKGKIVLLSGEYKCYDKDGKLTGIHKFDNGNYISFTEYYPSGTMLSFFDYTKHCDGQEHSWHIATYEETGKLIGDECIKKGADGKWPRMRG
jgi:hypothetical protein